MKKGKLSLLIAALLTIMLLGCDMPLTTIGENGQFKIIFIDVDQGDAALLISPKGKTMLIDGGTKKQYDKVEQVLEQERIHQLDVIIGTHPHDDHIGSLASVMRHFPVRSIYVNGEADTEAYAELKAVSRDKGLEIKEICAGDPLDWDSEVRCQVVGPKNTYATSQLNNLSIMLRLEYGNHSYLFTGDAEKDEELEALRMFGKDLQSTVLKVGHHGSATSTTPAFVKTVQPLVAVISVGNNSYGHPDNLVIRRLQLLGAEVYSTERNGTLILESDGKEMWLEAHKNNEEYGVLACVA